jgi:protease I
MNYAMKLRTPALLALLIVFAAGCEGRKAEDLVPEPGLLQGKNVAFLITEGFHDGETMFPMGYLINHGANVTVIGVERGEYTAYNSDVTAIVTRSVNEVSPADFDALVIPGGHSPANLREHEDVITFVRAFVETDKPTAAICHGPQVLVTAGVIEGRTLTGVGGIRDEITGAGATFEDVEVMVDGNIITSRTPPDLPAFSRQIAQSLR